MFTCYCKGGVCLQTMRPMSDGGLAVVPAQFLGPVKVPIVLSAPVGDGPTARNTSTDVAAIQRGFNALLPGDRGFLPELKVDGLCGPKTKDSIQKFQIKYFGWNGADRLMEPGKQTIRKLNELLGTKQFIAPTLADIAQAMGLELAQIQGAFDASFALARAWISAGYHRTLNPSPAPDPLIEKYFLISQQRDKARARGQVATIFGRLNTFFARPGGLWGEQAFQPEPKIRATNTFAWTEAGGYFKPGKVGFVPMDEKETLFPMRLDTIYYTLRFILMPIEARAYTIVHELCHFVSLDPEILDTVYAHKDPAGFHALPAAVRITNTDHYAMMAFEAGTGRTESPVVP